MESITLKKCEDGTIWVTSDEDQNGTESSFVKITDEKEQMMIALAEFLGFEPANVLDFESIQKSDENVETKVGKINYKPLDRCAVHFSSLKDADLVMRRLKDIMSMYDVATVADLYDLAGFPTAYSDNWYGWVKWEGFTIDIDNVGGYSLITPKTIPIL